jgi:hypothetical protein
MQAHKIKEPKEEIDIVKEFLNSSFDKTKPRKFFLPKVRSRAFSQNLKLSPISRNKSRSPSKNSQISPDPKIPRKSEDSRSKSPPRVLISKMTKQLTILKDKDSARQPSLDR